MSRFIQTFILLALSAVIFTACQPKAKPNLTPEETAEYLEQGKEIIKQSFMALSGQLAAAMQEGGVQNAVSYCNLHASPIIDSLSRVYNAEISRVTSRPRNQANMANVEEVDILADYLKVLSVDGPLSYFVQSTSREDVTFYGPILIISPLCLKCHGEIGSEIASEDYELIRTLYPEDQATGYKHHELRGLWKVKFH